MLFLQAEAIARCTPGLKQNRFSEKARKLAHGLTLHFTLAPVRQEICHSSPGHYIRNWDKGGKNENVRLRGVVRPTNLVA